MTKTVLFVDDESNILNSLKRLLRHEEYNLITASSAQEGLQVLREKSIDLVVSDQRMPEVPGNEFLQTVKEQYPETVRVILSGYADINVILDAVNKGEIYRFLTKPWNDEELKVVLRQCLAHYDLLRENRQLVGDLQRMNLNLEGLIQERTRSLQLSQEILENLPTLVLGINNEGTILLTNHMLRQKFGTLVGSKLQDIFPDEMAGWILDFVNQKHGQHWTQWDSSGCSFFLQARLLGSPDFVRGCLVMLEEL